MKPINEKQLAGLTALFCAVIFIGFAAGRALVSIGMVGLLVLPVLSGQLTNSLRNYVAQPRFWLLSFFLLIVVVSGLWSADKEGWLNWVRIKLPYLALPLAFAAIKKLPQKTFVTVLYSFMLTFLVSTVIILFKYFTNFEQTNNLFLSGSAMPIPYSHIRYSLMLGFSFFCALYLYSSRFYLFNTREKHLQIAFMLFAFIALHVISVRSGLLAMYLGLAYLAVRYLVTQKRGLWAFGVLVLLPLIAYAAYSWVPSLKNKITYMQYDLREYSHGNINGRSDAMRIVSIKLGWEIWKQNPILGIGAGDIKSETAKLYKSQYPDIEESNYRLPHNQWIWVLATTGVIGFALFAVAFVYPFFQNGFYKHWPLMVLFIFLFSSFFTEHTLEEQMGTAFYLVFLLLLSNHFSAE